MTYLHEFRNEKPAVFTYKWQNYYQGFIWCILPRGLKDMEEKKIREYTTPEINISFKLTRTEYNLQELQMLLYI